MTKKEKMAFDFKSDTVEIDDTTYHVQEISIGQRRKILAAFNKSKDSTMYSAGLIQGGCDEFEGVSDDEIMEMPASIFDAIAEAVANVSGMNPDDDDEEGGTKKAD
jgi:hypothetical protein